MLLACHLTAEELAELPKWMYPQTVPCWLRINVERTEYPGCCGLIICCNAGCGFSTHPPGGQWGTYENLEGLKNALRNKFKHSIRSSLIADVKNGHLIGLARWVFEEDKLELVWNNMNKNSGNEIFLWVLRN